MLLQSTILEPRWERSGWMNLSDDLNASQQILLSEIMPHLDIRKRYTDDELIDINEVS